MEPDLDRTRAMFTRMTGDGLDVARPLRWGYVFFHGEPETLKTFARAMSQNGYEPESLHRTDDGRWVLQLARTETHSADTLHQRNVELGRLAAESQLNAYDGWDVGAVMPPPEI